MRWYLVFWSIKDVERVFLCKHSPNYVTIKSYNCAVHFCFNRRRNCTKIENTKNSCVNVVGFFNCGVSVVSCVFERRGLYVSDRCFVCV